MLEWRRIPGIDGGTCASRWLYGESGYAVIHCGHPTALWPWYGLRPDGLMILAPNGRAFQHVKDAKRAVEAEVLTLLPAVKHTNRSVRRLNTRLNTGRKVMPRAKVKFNKSKAIRELLRDDPSATPKQIKEALALKGIKVTSTLISQVKYNPPKGVKRLDQPSNGSVLDINAAVERLEAAKTFVADAGGVDQARELIAGYERIAK